MINIRSDVLIEPVVNDDSEQLRETTIDIDVSSIKFNISVDDPFKYPSILLFSPSLLMVAAFLGAENCFTYLINCNASLDDRDKEGRTVAHFACAGGNMNIIRYLSNDVDFSLNSNNNNDNNDFKQSPAYYAIRFGHIDVIKYLYIHGVSKFDTVEQRIIAFYFGFYDIVSFFIDKIPFENESRYYYDYICESCCGGHSRIVQKMFNQMNPKNKLRIQQTKNCLGLAINSGSLDTVKVICESSKRLYKNHTYLYNVGINNASMTPFLDVAIYFIKCIGSSKLLIARSQPLVNAVKNDYIQMASFLLNKSSDITKDVICQLVNDSNSLEMIEMLLSYINETIFSEKELIVMRAASSNNLEIFLKLKEKGLSFNFVTDCYLIKCYKESILYFLIENGASLKYTGQNWPLINILKSGNTIKLMTLRSLGVNFSNNLIQASCCLQSPSNTRKGNFMKFILENVPDIDLSAYPDLLLNMASRRTQSENVLNAVENITAVINQDFINDAIQSKNRLLIILLLKRGIKIEIKDFYDFFDVDDLKKIIEIRPDLLADFYRHAHLLNVDEKLQFIKQKYFSSVEVIVNTAVIFGNKDNCNIMNPGIENHAYFLNKK